MTSDLSIIAGFAAVTALWQQLRGAIDRVRGTFIVRTTLDGSIAYTVSDFLYSQSKCWRWGDIIIRSDSAWVRPRERVMEVAYETAPVSPVLSFWNGFPFAFQSPAHPQGGSRPERNECITITCIRGTLDVSALIKAAIDWQSLRDSTGRRYRVRRIGGDSKKDPANYHSGQGTAPAPAGSERMRPGTRYLHWSEEDIGAPKSAAPFESYHLSEVAESCRADFKRWCSLKNWYLKRGIPWRRGHLLYGPPGTGKTALVRALAQEADMPVFCYDLSTLNNGEFCYSWESMQESAPCIALIEDIDGVFHGRENVLANQDGMRSSLTFDCLLNALGGIQTADGVFVVITTNKPETLDEALGKPTADGKSSRPGRIDRVFELLPPAADIRAEIIKRICDEVTIPDLEETAEMTAAQVTEWAICKALNKTWENAA